MRCMDCVHYRDAKPPSDWGKCAAPLPAWAEELLSIGYMENDVHFARRGTEGSQRCATFERNVYHEVASKL